MASTSREEIRRLNNQISSKNEQNQKLTKDIQGFRAVISNNETRMNNLTSDLEKQKRTVGKYRGYSIQVDTLKNELQVWSFGKASLFFVFSCVLLHVGHIIDVPMITLRKTCQRYWKSSLQIKHSKMFVINKKSKIRKQN